jgi:putative nucleotidyltransferase with HDIG domain
MSDEMIRERLLANQDALSLLVDTEPQLAFLPRVFERFSESEWYLVGGAVRDLLIGGREINDYDFVVRNLELDELVAYLSEIGYVDLVGRDFGVIKFRPHGAERPEEVDIAWPRTERAGMSGGYRDVAVQADMQLPIEKDLDRRDFTINAIAWDVRRRRLIDPHHGISDIETRTIRAVGEAKERFQEDLTRILRAVRLAAQLGYGIEDRTWEAVKRLAPQINTEKPGSRRNDRDEIEPTTEYVVPREAVAREFIKALRADAVRAVDLLEISGLLFWVIPELGAMGNCPQPESTHAEGNVWDHAKLSVAALFSENFRDFFGEEEPVIETVVAALLHDVGKPSARRLDKGEVHWDGHSELGAQLTRSIARRLKLSSVPGGFNVDRLVWLVQHHTLPNIFKPAEMKRGLLERFFLKDPVSGRALLHLAYADVMGRKKAGGQPVPDNLRATMAAIEDVRLNLAKSGAGGSLLSGQEVMQIGDLQAGPEVGQVLADLREAQLAGEITDQQQAQEFVKKYLG